MWARVLFIGGGSKMTKEEIHKLYYKERARIKRLVSYYEKRGFVFQNAKIIPDIPKKITEGSIRSLQKITKETIQRKGTYINKETGKTITGSTYVTQQSKKKYKPKATPKKKEKETRNKYYKKSKKKKGKGKPPSETNETIANLFDEMDRKPYSTHEKEDSYWYDDDDDLSYFNHIIDEINNWSPLPGWSENFAEAKRGHRRELIKVFKTAIQNVGKKQVARNISRHSGVVTEMIQRILYGGSGRDAVRMFDQIHDDLLILPSILEDRVLTQEEAEAYTNVMEEDESYDGFDEL